MGKASKQKQNERRAAKLAVAAPPENTIEARDRWGTDYTLSRRADGRWHGTCRTANEAGQSVDMPFAVPDAVAREWQKNRAENRDMRASGSSHVPAKGAGA